MRDDKMPQGAPHPDRQPGRKSLFGGNALKVFLIAMFPLALVLVSLMNGSTRGTVSGLITNSPSEASPSLSFLGVLPWLLLTVLAIFMVLRPRQPAIPGAVKRFQLGGPVQASPFDFTVPDRSGRIRDLWKDLRISAQKAGTVGIAVLSALLISIASFWTTFIGTLSFFGYSPLQVIFGFILAFGIQSTLYLASWFVAEEMATRGIQSDSQRQRLNDIDDLPERRGFGNWFLIKHFGKVATLLICMLASVFFSFSAHFENVYGEKRLLLANLQNARADTQQVITSTEQAIRNERNAEANRLTTRDEGWKQFDTALEGLLKLAETRPDDVRRAVSEKRITAEAAINKLQSEIEGYRTEVSRINREIEAVKTRSTLPLSGIASESIITVEQRVESLRQQVAELETKKQLESKINGNPIEDLPPACQLVARSAKKPGNGKRTNPGRGPVTKCIENEQKEANVKLSSAVQELNSLRKRREDGLTSTARGKEQIENLEANRDTVIVKLKTAEARQKDQERALEEIKGANDKLFASAGNQNELVKTIRRDRDEFLRTGSKLNFDQMSLNCANLVEIMQTVREVAANVSANACNTAAFSATIDRLTTLDVALATYKQKCVIDDKFNRMTSPAAYVAYGSECLAIAKVPDRTTRQSAIIDDIAQLNDPNASNFERSIASLWRGDRLAWLALALAISVDIIVFLSAVLGARSDSSIFTRNGHVTSNEGLKDLLAGLVDPTLHGDEPGPIRASKIFLSATRLEASADRNRVLPIHVIDLNRVSKSYELPLSNMINNAAAIGMAVPLANRPLAYEIHQDLLTHHSRVVDAYENEYLQRNGPRPVRNASADFSTRGQLRDLGEPNSGPSLSIVAGSRPSTPKPLDTPQSSPPPPRGAAGSDPFA